MAERGYETVTGRLQASSCGADGRSIVAVHVTVPRVIHPPVPGRLTVASTSQAFMTVQKNTQKVRVRIPRNQENYRNGGYNHLTVWYILSCLSAVLVSAFSKGLPHLIRPIRNPELPRVLIWSLRGFSVSQPVGDRVFVTCATVPAHEKYTT